MPLRCSRCNDLLIGRYVSGEYIGDLCLTCFDDLPTCARCTSRFLEGRASPPLCPACDAVVRDCGICGQPALSTTWSHTRCDTICETCFDALPHCHRCHIPTRHPSPLDEPPDAILCVHCWRDTPRCHVCERHLVGTFVTYESEPNRAFCPHCAKHADTCDFCARPLRSPHRYPDGRLSCTTCRATAITDLRELRKLQAISRRYLMDTLHLTLRPAPDCPIHLVPASELAALQGKHFQATTDFDARERGLFVSRISTLTRGDTLIQRDVQLDIYIEDGLPRSAALGTMVHELTHLWQFDHFPPNSPLHLIEGLACWTQFHLLRAHGERLQAKYVALRTDPIYGDGFRTIRAIEREHGFDGTIPALLQKIEGS